MQAPGTPSVDQLLVLLTVVEEGSFTSAARRLRRATSAVSYAIDTLEAQLGLPLTWGVSSQAHSFRHFTFSWSFGSEA